MAALSKLATSPLGLLTSFLKYINPRTMTRDKLGWIFFLLLLLSNKKVLPFFWHSRFYSALFLHLFVRRQKVPDTTHLFAPVVTQSRSPMYECDFNLHKSNSTYFSDLDISRTHLVCNLIKKSLRLRRQRGDRPLYVALGGVVCLFRREIKPYESYEMWTRVLCWDQKWLFVVTHFVSKPAKSRTGKDREGSDGERKVFASALSKYVFKSARRTVQPSIVLEESGVLPPRPAHMGGSEAVLDADKEKDKGESLMGSAGTVSDSITHSHLQHLSSATASEADPSRSSSPAPNKLEDLGSIVAISQKDGSDSIADLEAQLGADKIDKWDWETCERVRMHGLGIARHMLAIDKLEGEFEDGNGRSGIIGPAPLSFFEFSLESNRRIIVYTKKVPIRLPRCLVPKHSELYEESSGHIVYLIEGITLPILMFDR